MSDAAGGDKMLTRLARTGGVRQAEDVATAALLHLLERYDRARITPHAAQLRLVGRLKRVADRLRDAEARAFRREGDTTHG